MDRITSILQHRQHRYEGVWSEFWHIVQVLFCHLWAFCLFLLFLCGLIQMVYLFRLLKNVLYTA
jgi:sterol desaturase/sphingolipid hydroxylase (fatty acid hydroxylase superfamily)